ncbi:hypothetical protein HYU06_05500 [Candidatus Woesearchaeota archaeon]|nr:hypothetical protein [Candidatus Woesearchaeota archaeon]
MIFSHKIFKLLSINSAYNLRNPLLFATLLAVAGASSFAIMRPVPARVLVTSTGQPTIVNKTYLVTSVKLGEKWYPVVSTGFYRSFERNILGRNIPDDTLSSLNIPQLKSALEALASEYNSTIIKLSERLDSRHISIDPSIKQEINKLKQQYYLRTSCPDYFGTFMGFLFDDVAPNLRVTEPNILLGMDVFVGTKAELVDYLVGLYRRTKPEENQLPYPINKAKRMFAVSLNQIEVTPEIWGFIDIRYKLKNDGSKMVRTGWNLAAYQNKQWKLVIREK